MGICYSDGYSDYFNYVSGPYKNIKPIPITNHRGELLIRPSPISSFVLNAFATPVQQALAWDFLKFMTVTLYVEGHAGFIHPIKRDLLPFRVRWSMYGRSNEVNTFWELRGDPEDNIENVINIFTAYSEMPMQHLHILPRRLMEHINYELYLFREGLLSAEDTAVNLQNRVELMLMEMDKR